jgi:hypothetical protein
VTVLQCLSPVAVIMTLAAFTAPLHGQLSRDNRVRLEVRVSASFDRDHSNTTVFDKYVSGSRGSIVQSRVARWSCGERSPSSHEIIDLIHAHGLWVQVRRRCPTTLEHSLEWIGKVWN